MPTLRETIKTTLTDDPALTALVSAAHIYDAATLPRDGLSAASAPRLSGGVRLAPHIKLRWRDAVDHQTAVRTLAPERATLEIYAYQDAGYATVEAVLRRCKDLLHDRYLTPDDYGVAHMLFTFRSGELPADEYPHASLMFARFAVITV